MSGITGRCDGCAIRGLQAALSAEKARVDELEERCELHESEAARIFMAISEAGAAYSSLLKIAWPIDPAQSASALGHGAIRERAAKDEAIAKLEGVAEACAKELDRLAGISQERAREARDSGDSQSAFSFNSEAVGYERGASQLRAGAWRTHQ